MPTLTDRPSEIILVLLALKAYANGQLPPWQCAPNGPGHEKDWIQRVDRLLTDARDDASPTGFIDCRITRAKDRRPAQPLNPMIRTER